MHELHPILLRIQTEFQQQLDALGPFAPSPHLAVAVSGGADSMALCLLAHAWAQAQGGRITALTVDHGLRPESASEAQQVAAWLQAHDIEHHILRITVPLTGNLQQSAREARYALLKAYCRTHHIRHLLTAHHRDDQAETLLLRLSRGSGVDGMSAIPTRREADGLHILRPLLAFPKSALTDYLRCLNQPWIEDPSNRTDTYARNRLRLALEQVEDAETLSARLAGTAAHLARAREALEHYTALAGTQCATFYPEGYALLKLEYWRTQPEEIRLRLLRDLLHSIGGLLPRFDDLSALEHRLHEDDFPGACLSGCQISLPLRKQEAGLLMIQRELAHITAALPLQNGDSILWDNRFRITLACPPGDTGPYRVAALGAQQASQLKSALAPALAARLPHAVIASLPALWRLEEALAAPHIGYARAGTEALAFTARFAPAKPLAAEMFCYTLKPE